jgi:hypothetical protein
MFFFNMFRQPYLDAPGDLGGGGNPAPADPTPDPTPAPEPTPTSGGDPALEPTPEPQKIKVKYNHQELELPYDEAVTHIQKGMNYEKAVERARQEARDAWIAEQGYEWNGKAITTEAEYKEAVREAEIRKSLENRELPPEVIEELVESRKFREESKAEKQTRQQQERQQKDFQAFFEAYPDIKPNQIPAEVWQEVQNGKSLVDAYAKHENTQLKTKLAEYEAKFKAQETNNANASSSPGSVTGNGENPADFISRETFEANKKDQKWIIKNLTRIQASRAKW